MTSVRRPKERIPIPPEAGSGQLSGTITPAPLRRLRPYPQEFGKQGSLWSSYPPQRLRITDSGLTDLDNWERPRTQLTTTSGYRFRDLYGDHYRLDVSYPRYRPSSRTVNRDDRGGSPFLVDFDLRRTVQTDHRFDLQFWSEFAFDTYECPGRNSCPNYFADGTGSRSLRDRVLYVLPRSSPNFHIRTHAENGQRRLSDSRVRAISRAIPRAVEQLTGETFAGTITTGSHDISEEGWVTIRASSEDDSPDLWDTGDPDTYYCGRANVGWEAGSIWLNSDRISLSSSRYRCTLVPLLIHEIGHAMGFFHVGGSRHAMNVGINEAVNFSSAEQYHARIAYQLGRHTPFTSDPSQGLLRNQRGEDGMDRDSLDPPPLTSWVTDGHDCRRVGVRR